MKLENFINLQLLHPVNVLLIIGIASLVPFIFAAVAAGPPKHPTTL
jgi:hypothetical protein